MEQIQEQKNQISVSSALSQQERPGLSSVYRFVNTKDIVQKFLDAGWLIRKQVEVSVRSIEREGFQKHMLHLYKPGDSAFKIGEDRIEIVIVNSHDGLNAFKFMAGIFRLVCSNGLVVSKATFETVRFIHKTIHTFDVDEVVSKVSNRINTISGQVNRMRNINLPEDSRLEFANHAMKIRYPDEAPEGLKSSSMLRARRADDLMQQDNVWTTYNIVQENLMKGGISYFPSTELVQRRPHFRSRNRTRSISNIQKNVNVNQRLWDLAIDFSKGEKINV